MKYIRTKDGIYNLNAKAEYQHFFSNGEEYVVLAPKSEHALSQLINKDNILKSANTIEELCDEFVVLGVYKTNKGVPFNSLSETLNYLDEHRDWEQLTIYGAIWTEWGLKYVAKMNEKGELELL